MEFLQLRCAYDDGFIAYIDGTEVARANMLPGDADYRLGAEKGVSDIWEFVIQNHPVRHYLAPGEHVLAISVHNVPGGSSDMRLGNISLVAVPASLEETPR